MLSSDDMNALKRITHSLSQLSRALAPTHVTTGYCKRCDRETRWMVNLARGYFRCLECDAASEDIASERGSSALRQEDV